jgi:hypothetical protein
MHMHNAPLRGAASDLGGGPCVGRRETCVWSVGLRTNLGDVQRSRNDTLGEGRLLTRAALTYLVSSLNSRLSSAAQSQLHFGMYLTRHCVALERRFT